MTLLYFCKKSNSLPIDIWFQRRMAEMTGTNDFVNDDEDLKIAAAFRLLLFLPFCALNITSLSDVLISSNNRVFIVFYFILYHNQSNFKTVCLQYKALPTLFQHLISSHNFLFAHAVM